MRFARPVCLQIGCKKHTPAAVQGTNNGRPAPVEPHDRLNRHLEPTICASTHTVREESPSAQSVTLCHDAGRQPWPGCGRGRTALALQQERGSCLGRARARRRASSRP